MMRALLLVTSTLFALKAFSAPTLVSFLSQKTNEIRNFQSCVAASRSENLILSDSKQSCHRYTPNLARGNYDEISEDLFFENAARSQIASYDCLAAQSKALQNVSGPTSESREAIAKNFVVKIPKLIKLNDSLAQVNQNIEELQRLQVTSPMGETMQDTLADSEKLSTALKKRKELQAAIEMLTSSLYQGQHHLTREWLQRQLEKRPFDSEKFQNAFLRGTGDGSFNQLLNQISQEASRDKALLLSKAKDPSGGGAEFELSDKDKIRLYADRNWLKDADVRDKSSTEKVAAMDALSCRMEGRYGIGRDRFYTAAEIGGSAALMLVPGGLYLAAGRGLIALQTARTLALATATGISSLTLATTYEQKCSTTTLKTSMKMKCEDVSKSVVQNLAEENCALDVALAALDIPFPELKAAGVMAFGMGMTKGTQSALKAAKNPQLQIWRAKELGHALEAKQLESSVLKTMQDGKMTVTGMVGSDVSKSGAFYVTFEDGTEGIWKPALGRYSGGEAEIAVSKIDKHLGTEQVPLTVKRSLSGVDGTVQLKVGDLQVNKGHPATDGWNPDALGYFDFLIGNNDRHPENYLKTKDGKLVAIDHGLAFQKVPNLPQMEKLESELDFLKQISDRRKANERLLQESLSGHNPDLKISAEQIKARIVRDKGLESEVRTTTLNLAAAMTPPKEVVDRLRSTTAKEWQNLVGQNLSSKQIDELVARQRIVLDLIDRSERALGSGVYQAGPVSQVLRHQTYPQPH